MKVDELTLDNFEELLSNAEDSATMDWEMVFCSDIRNKFDQYGEEIYVSEKQLDTLEKIVNGWVK